MLDFVPNHMAPDHEWIDEHPDYFVHGSDEDLARSPRNYRRVQTKNGPTVLAYGRDPYFDGWPDTLQLNYGNPDLQQAMIGELERIAGQCDGVRCDMAMLVLPDVFGADLGHSGRPLLAEGDRGRAARASAFPVHGGGLLGSGMDDAAARLRLRVRQAPLRPPARCARTAVCASILHAALDYQDKLAALPRKPRRTPDRGDLRARPARGRGRRHVSFTGSCASFTRASSRAAGSAFRRTSCGRHRSLSMQQCRRSTRT